MYLLLQWLRMSFDQIIWTDLVTKLYKVQCLVLVLLWSHRIRKLLLLPQTRKLPTVVTVYYCTEVGNSQRNSQISDQKAMHLPAAARKAFLQHWKSYMRSFHWWHLIRILLTRDSGKWSFLFCQNKNCTRQKGLYSRQFQERKETRAQSEFSSIETRGRRTLIQRGEENTGHVCFLTGFTQRKSKHIVFDKR